MSNSLNVISFFHGSTIREAARRPIVTYDLHGSHQVPCTMDIVDRFEQTEKALGDRFEATLSATGPGARGEFKIVADANPEEIDSPETPKNGHGEHTIESMSQHIVDNWKEDAYNLVHVRAHGHAHEDVMGMPTKDFLAALDKAGKKVGRPIGTVLLESCLMGSFEVLNGMSGSVGSVNASQEVLNAKALPHQAMFTSALNGEMEPREVASRMMEAAREHGTADTLIAVEPAKLGAVEKALGSLKEELDSRSSEDRSFRKKAAKTLKSSAHFPRRGVETGYRRKLDLRDLGELSQAFASEEFGPEVTESSKNLEKAFKGAVIDVVRGPGYESASGLSVQGSSVMEKQGFSFFGLF